ncbi:hypothetical protein [Undibacterium sp.]|uniref:hypothetical protein n=1 Tax=Undibacterium sp. TaxID=1914977 RepID=UPI003752DCF5
MKYIYTPKEATQEIIDLYKRHLKNSKVRETRYKAGEISARSKSELEARDERDMRDLVLSFIHSDAKPSGKYLENSLCNA